MQIYAIKTKKANTELLSLFCSVNFDKNRINIAESDWNGEKLTLWLEDKQDFKEQLDDCVIVEVSSDKFAKIIADEKLNTYEAEKYRDGYAYAADVEINKPIAWFEEDADQYFRKEAINAVLTKLLKGLVS